MSESLEAAAFDKELDKVLSGRPVSADLDPETALDLAFAAKLAKLDLSGENRGKREMKMRLLERAEGSRLRRILARAGVRPSVLAACAVLLVAGAALFRSTAPTEHFSMITLGLEQAQQALGGASSSIGNASNAAGAAPSYRGLGSKYGALSSGGGLARSGKNYADAFAGAASRAASANVKLSAEAMPEPVDREGYEFTPENPFQKVADHPLSTFSIDVDAASYSNTRRILNESRMPPADAVRIEEFINYFHYDYPEPRGEHPFSITTELAACPWNAKHKLVRVGIKGKSIAKQDLPPNNLVFLIDTSGSMMSADKLPLLKSGLRLLVAQLRAQDKLSIVAYAGSAGLVLPATSGARKAEIIDALDRLQAGGSTAGGAGIQLAYQVAADNFMKKGSNRVILATDGDFNVGVTSDGELTRMIEEKREHGVFLTVLGFGTGNVQDHKMEQLADKGNGNYAYVDDILEAQKVLVKEMGATLLTIAKDVKIQIEFNPGRVQAYKLLGYENRMLRAEDFNDDKKDAGELGAGSGVTALYEVVPAGVKDDSIPSVDPLKYQKAPEPATAAADGGELLTVKFRYKKPDGNTSLLITRPLADEDRAWALASPDFKFAASAAGFGMMLRHSKTKGDLSYDKVRAMAQESLGADEDGYRSEMVRLIAKAKLLDAKER